MRLSKHIGVSWLSARRILKKIRTARAHRDSIYRLDILIEFDDTFVAGKRAEKRGVERKERSRFWSPLRLEKKELVLSL